MLRLQETPLSAAPIGRSTSSSPPGSRGARSQSNFYWKQIRQRKEIRAGRQPWSPCCCPPLTHKGQMSALGRGHGDTLGAVLAALQPVGGQPEVPNPLGQPGGIGTKALGGRLG